MQRLLLLFAYFIACLGSAVLLGQSELPEGYMGSEVCMECHDESDIYAYEQQPHYLEIVAHGLEEKACEGCHGPGEEHVLDPMPENILGNGKTAAISAECRSCHAQMHTGLGMANPAHTRNDVNCLDCHGSGHKPAPAKPMLAMAQPDLCGQCHTGQVLEFNAPFAHRSGHQGVQCGDCHPSHAETTLHTLLETPGRSACVGCHTDKAGPFVFPHPNHGLDGCAECHAPHGSPNPFMLTRADVNNLCLECHIDTPTFHDLTRPRYQSCSSCHAAVHGSQRDSRLFEE